MNGYIVFSNYDDKAFKQLKSGSYRDSFLLSYYCKHRAVFKKKQQSDGEAWKMLEQKIKKGTKAPKDRLKILISVYCYKLRNRSFHAERAYPLFIISEDVETEVEQILTEIILLTVKDLFQVYVNKARAR